MGRRLGPGQAPRGGVAGSTGDEVSRASEFLQATVLREVPFTVQKPLAVEERDFGACTARVTQEKGFVSWKGDGNPVVEEPGQTLLHTDSNAVK